MSVQNLAAVTIDLVCMRRCGWMDDKGIRRMKRWRIIFGELGMDYRDLRIRSDSLN